MNGKDIITGMRQYFGNSNKWISLPNAQRYLAFKHGLNEYEIKQFLTFAEKDKQLDVKNGQAIRIRKWGVAK